MVRGQRKKIQNGQKGKSGLKTRVGGSTALAEAGLHCTADVYRSEKFEEEVTVLRDSSSESESCQEF